MDGEEAGAIGFTLWRVRDQRGKALRPVAQLAGMSKDTLNRIETGRRSPTLAEIGALAEALQISSSELTRLPVPAPANGHTDSSTEAVRLTLDAIDMDDPGGLVLPLAVLRDRVTWIQRRSRACRFAEVASALPQLTRDLHTTLSTSNDHGEVLRLAVHLHVHVTRMWLSQAGAPTDLRRRVAFLARRLAHEHEAAAVVGMATFGVADVLAGAGAVDLARAELDGFALPATTADTVGMVSALTVTRGLLGDAGRPGDAGAAMDAATDMTGRFGELGWADPLGFGFGPTNVGFRRVRLALEFGEPDRAVGIAEGLHPDRNPFPAHRCNHWVEYGRALARLRGRHDDAVRALRHAETIHPHRVLRDPFVRDTLAVLLRSSRRGSPMDQELRGMAHRAGLLV